MYGKLFPEIFESTLMAEGGRDAVYVFMCMIALKDKHGVVPIDVRILARKIDMELEDLEEALEVLTSPDDTSNLPDYDGRRLIPLREINDIEGNRGWWVVNHEHYRKKASTEDRNEQNKIHQQKHRDKNSNSKQPSASVSNRKQPSASVSKRKQESAASAHTDTDTDTDTESRAKTRRFTPPSLEEVKLYCQSRENNIDPETFRDFYQAKDWMIGKNKMKDWKAAMHTWERRNPIPQDNESFLGGI